MNNSSVSSFRLTPEIVVPLRHALPEVAGRAVTAITAEVPAYAEAFAGEMGPKIEGAVRAALATFLNLVSRSATADTGRSGPMAPALEGAYALGRGEARHLIADGGIKRHGALPNWLDIALEHAGVDAMPFSKFESASRVVWGEHG